MSRPSRFAVHLDTTKTTSGQRFYRDLHDALSARSIPLDERPDVVLFNVSAPLPAILGAKLRGERVVLRVDGFTGSPSPRFIAAIPAPLRSINRLASSFPGCTMPARSWRICTIGITGRSLASCLPTS